MKRILVGLFLALCLSAQAQGLFNVPFVIPGLFQWNSSRALTRPLGDNSVSRIQDISGNGNHFYQPTVANQGTYGTDANNIPYVRMDGVNDWMANNLWTSFGQPNRQLSNDRNYTVYMVLNPISWTANDYFFSALGSNQGAQQITSTPSVRVYNSASSPNITQNVALGSKLIIVVRFSSADARFGVNFVTALTGTMNGGGAPGGIMLGASSATGSFGNYDFYDFVFCRGKHNQAMETSIINFLAKRNKVAIATY